jgi:hypothetical protein
MLFLAAMINSSNAQGPPINTDTPIFLGLEGRGIRTFLKYSAGEKGNIYAIPVIIPYTVMTDMLIGVGVSYISKFSQTDNSRSGLGDASVFIKYLFIQEDGHGKTFRMALKIRETFPSGKSGMSLDAYQTYIGVLGTRISTKAGLYTELGYILASNQISNRFIYNFAIGYPLMPPTYPPNQINLYLELNGMISTEKKNHLLFISPGIQYIPGRKVLFEIGTQLPIIEDTRDNNNIDFILTFGTRILLF